VAVGGKTPRISIIRNMYDFNTNITAEVEKPRVHFSRIFV
jgi:hypothetical protein